MPEHIFLTGGAGFIGSHVARRLLGRGDRVTVLDDFNDFYDPARSAPTSAALAEFRGASGWSKATSATPRWSTASSRRELHRRRPPGGAGRCPAEPARADPLRRRQLHRHPAPARSGPAPRPAATSSSPPLLRSTASTRRSLSPRTTGRTARSAPTRPPSAAGELLCYNYSHLYGLRTSCLRFFTVYGPAQRPEMAITSSPTCSPVARTMPMLGDGQQPTRLHLCRRHRRWRRGGARPGARASRSSTWAGRRDDGARRLRPLARRGAGRRAAHRHLADQPGDVPITYADVTKAGRLLGYAPKVPIREGLRRYVAWLQGPVSDVLPRSADPPRACSPTPALSPATGRATAAGSRKPPRPADHPLTPPTPVTPGGRAPTLVRPRGSPFEPSGSRSCAS